MTTRVPRVALFAYSDFSPFHFAVPYLVFSIELAGRHLFELKIVSPGGRPLTAERALTLQPDGGLELIESADIVVVPGWSNLNTPPSPDLASALTHAHERGARVVGLCYGTYALAYAGLLNGRRAATHWMAERDFHKRFPSVKLDMNALYVEEDRLITSAGTGAGIDCCLHIVREYHGPKIANRVARMIVIPPHREGGQAQFIEQPMAVSTQDAHVNRLLDYLRENLGKQHTIDDLAQRASMSRRTFTRHFCKATGMTLTGWLVNERIQRTRELLETTSMPVERISDLVGFQTTVSLRQHFKKRFHVSPRDWRRAFGQKSTTGLE
jgi:transcriptional regulator GlxA family with amidase domain